MFLTDEVEVIYSPAHWQLLQKLRIHASEIMLSLSSRGLVPFLYGSVVRGDVTSNSDVDIIIPYVVSSHAIEIALSRGGFKIQSKKIAQATPNHAPKAHIYLNFNESTCVSFPLVHFRGLELAFYRFGGIIDLSSLKCDTRVPGCDKQLQLIQPTKKGHFELPIIGREVEVAKILGVDPEIVKERVKVLSKRKEKGKSGIFLSLSLAEDEVFEDVLRRMASSNPIIRRIIRKRN